MFGTIGGPELFLILVIALIVFGPQKLPEIGRSLGRMILEFKKATTEFQQTVEREIDADKLKNFMEMPVNPEENKKPAEPSAVPSSPTEPIVSRDVPPSESK